MGTPAKKNIEHPMPKANSPIISEEDLKMRLLRANSWRCLESNRATPDHPGRVCLPRHREFPAHPLMRIASTVIGPHVQGAVEANFRSSSLDIGLMGMRPLRPYRPVPRRS